MWWQGDNKKVAGLIPSHSSLAVLTRCCFLLSPCGLSSGSPPQEWPSNWLWNSLVQSIVYWPINYIFLQVISAVTAGVNKLCFFLYRYIITKANILASYSMVPSFNKERVLSWTGCAQGFRLILGKYGCCTLTNWVLASSYCKGARFTRTLVRSFHWQWKRWARPRMTHLATAIHHFDHVSSKT